MMINSIIGGLGGAEGEGTTEAKRGNQEGRDGT